MEKKNFLDLSYQILLEEIDNLFVKKDKDFFERACFICYDNVPFVRIQIKGIYNYDGGAIEIGSFFNNNQGNQELLIFRLLAPRGNPLTESYASCVNDNIEYKYVNFFNNDYNENYNQIKLFYQIPNIEWLIANGFKTEDFYKKDIYQFGFDDNTYKQYVGIYENLCKTIAAYAFCYFSTLTTYKDNLPIKRLCEKFGEVTEEEMTYYLANKQGIELSVDGELM